MNSVENVGFTHTVGPCEGVDAIAKFQRALAVVFKMEQL
jgi:hypothetical protein